MPKGRGSASHGPRRQRIRFTWPPYFPNTTSCSPDARPCIASVHYIPPLAAFAAYESPGVDLTMAKALYTLINLGGLGIFLWKLRGMGLLPVTAGDWVTMLPTRTPVEYSAVGTPF
jgi:hypothetical protein